MFGLVLVSDGQNEGPLNNGSDIYCSACSPLVWNNLSLFHMYRKIPTYRPWAFSVQSTAN